jgi:hypothetical protein
MTHYNKSIPFLLRLKYVLKRYLQKEKTGQAISDRESGLSARSADRRLVTNVTGRLR